MNKFKFFKKIILSLLLTITTYSLIYPEIPQFNTAGMLPYTIKDNKVLFLVGRDKHQTAGDIYSAGLFLDFGGKIDKPRKHKNHTQKRKRIKTDIVENIDITIKNKNVKINNKNLATALNAAGREGYEETVTLFGTPKELLKKLEYIFINHSSKYLEGLIKVDYINPQDFIDEEKNPRLKSVFKEKNAFAWIDAEGLVKKIEEIKAGRNWKKNYTLLIEAETTNNSYNFKTEYQGSTDKAGSIIQSKNINELDNKNIILFHWFAQTLKDGNVLDMETLKAVPNKRPIDTIKQIVYKQKYGQTDLHYAISQEDLNDNQIFNTTKFLIEN